MKLALGTVQSGGRFSFYPDADKNAFKAVVREALKRSITSFDTAYSYEDAETILASVFREQHAEREKLEITDKILPIPTLKEKTETSLRRLNTEYIDNLLIHWPDSDESALYRAMRTLEVLREEGKILHMGVSNFPLKLVKRISQDFEIEILERPVSLLWTRELEETLLFSKGRIKVAGYAPLCFGLLSGKYRSREALSDRRRNLPFFNTPSYLPLLDKLNRIAEQHSTSGAATALAWARQSGADMIIFGARNTEQLDIITASGFTLGEEEKNELDILAAEIDREIMADSPYGHGWRS